MILTLAGARADVDAEKTREMYARLPYIRQGCQCPLCRSFLERVANFDAEKRVFFAKIGVDAEKCESLWSYPGTRPGTQLYTFRCPLVCVDVSGITEEWETVAEGFSARFAGDGGRVFLEVELLLKWDGV